MTEKKRPHHHGDLRQALIHAGISLVESGGADALTLRQCARQAGVSHAAPAHHFNGINSLKQAIIARGHRMFSDSMNKAKSDADPSPTGQIHGICTGYIRFAQQHNALFKFMFSGQDICFDTLDETTKIEAIREKSASYNILRDACAPFGATDAEQMRIEITIWSLVHGYAMLFGNLPSLPPFAPENRRGPENFPEFFDLLPEFPLASNKSTSGC